MRTWRALAAQIRPSRVIIGVGILLAAVIAAVTTYAIIELRAAEIADAERDVTSFDAALVEQADRTFESADLLLVATTQWLQSTDGRAADAQAIHIALRGRLSGVPAVRRLSIFDADGRMRHDSEQFPAPAREIAARPYFRELSEDRRDRLVISDPEIGEVDGVWSIALARPIPGADGGLAGVVVATLDPAYFVALYRSIALRSDEQIALLRRDGVLLSRYPWSEQIVGRSFAKSVIFNDLLPKVDHGVTRRPSLVNGEIQIVGYAAAKAYPLVVTVGLTEGKALTTWRHEATILGMSALVATAIVMGLLGSLARQLARREAAEAQQKVVEEQLRQAQKMEAIGNLTGGIAHDFNNLLGIIIGNLDFLACHLKGDDAAQLIGEMMGAGLRGAELNRQLLAFARRQPLQPRVTDVHEIAAETTRLLARTLGENIELALIAEDDIWPVMVDPSQLQSALTNLGINARDAMPSGGTLTIEMGNVVLDAEFAHRNADVDAGDYVAISVTDSGVGMAPEVAQRVFEPFFTTKDIGKGTGLGLSMVFGFVKQSNGHVSLSSAVGKGTTFRLYLPRAAQVAPSAKGRSAGEATVPVGGGEVILVVEDNPGMRRVAVRQLNELGYATREAESAAAALELLRRGEAIDLLFTDVVMPGGTSGPDLAREATILRPGLKVIFASGFSDAATRHGSTLPADCELLSKPYRKPELARRLQRVLNAA
jgi:signal transduction histidine kinase